jgi:hypothetical protein
MSTNNISPLDEKFEELYQKAISFSLSDIEFAAAEKKLLADLIEDNDLYSLANKWNFSQNTARYYLNNIKTTVFDHIIEQCQSMID